MTDANGQTVATTRYRLRFNKIPEWYAAEVIGEHSLRFDTIEQAMSETKEWWLRNLREDWEDNYTLEEVEQ